MSEVITDKDNNRTMVGGRIEFVSDLNSVSDQIPDENTLIDLSDLFKIFGDSTRIKILFALQERPLFVGELAAALQMSNSAISHQLQVLRVNRLVKPKKEGKSTLYSLADFHVSDILRIGLEHILEKNTETNEAFED